MPATADPAPNTNPTEASINPHTAERMAGDTGVFSGWVDMAGTPVAQWTMERFMTRNVFGAYCRS
ncbi:hypothetical protein PBDP_3510 [Pseudomonas sp. St290]|jgi:hypothetical protein|nr:hypothetical protein PBDP_3510 [Pseudomonas sp. St290]